MDLYLAPSLGSVGYRTQTGELATQIRRERYGTRSCRTKFIDLYSLVARGSAAVEASSWLSLDNDGKHGTAVCTTPPRYGGSWWSSNHARSSVESGHTGWRTAWNIDGSANAPWGRWPGRSTSQPSRANDGWYDARQWAAWSYWRSKCARSGTPESGSSGTHISEPAANV